MKTTKDYLSEVLKDEMETVTATVLRKNIGECLTQVSLGKTFCIVRKRKVMGYLVPTQRAVLPEGTTVRPTLEELEGLLEREANGSSFVTMRDGRVRREDIEAAR